MASMLNKITNKILIGTIIILLISLSCILYFYRQKEKEKIIVAKVICAEMCSEGAIAMQGVANTVYNRMIKYNKTAYEIVTEENQYYGLTNSNRDKIFEDKVCRETSILLVETMNQLVDITNGAIYFRVDGEERQYWHKILTVRIGRIYFYK